MSRQAGEETVAWIYFCRDVVPFAAMVAVECAKVGSNSLFKAATLKGLSFYVFVFYSYVAATLVLLPVCFNLWKIKKISRSQIFYHLQDFLTLACGLMSQVAGCKGIEYSSPTLASAISNLTPAFTFMLAVFFRYNLAVKLKCWLIIFVTITLITGDLLKDALQLWLRSLARNMGRYPSAVILTLVHNVCIALSYIIAPPTSTQNHFYRSQEALKVVYSFHQRR